MVVQCSSRNLEVIPTHLPHDTMILLLSSNQISRIPGHAFRDLPRLQELDLSRNAIETLDADAFHGISNSLRTLDLSHNRLQGLPRDAFTRIHARVGLAGNPWHCECGLQEVLRELQLDPESAGEVSCNTATLEQYSGKPLLQVLDSGTNFCSVQHKTTDLAMFITMFAWFAMVIGYVVYYVRHNREDARRHLEYLKSLPSVSQGHTKDPDTVSTVL